MTKQYCNKHFLIRFFPDKEDKHTNQLIGYDKFLSLIDRAGTRKSILNQVMKSNNDKIKFKLRSGIAIEFVAR